MATTELINLAVEVSNQAYVPYSHFPIGAVLLTKDGEIYTGVNIENASFGLTNCGERTAIFKAVSEGARDFKELIIYGQTEKPISPCGACRQVIAEFFEPDLPVTFATMLHNNLGGSVMNKKQWLGLGLVTVAAI